MTQIRLPWLIALTAVAAAMFSLVIPYVSRDSPIESRFPLADGVSVRAESIDFSPTLQLNLRYCTIADNGVELELIADGTRLWHAYAKPLGVEHSFYRHSVKCAIVDGRIALHSEGTYGSFTEFRELTTGKLIDRKEFPRRPEPAIDQPKPSDEEIQRRIDAFRDQAIRAAPINEP